MDTCLLFWIFEGGNYIVERGFEEYTRCWMGNGESSLSLIFLGLLGHGPLTLSHTGRRIPSYHKPSIL
jgi:hypothetical protein